jgi:hypothetical protein
MLIWSGRHVTDLIRAEEKAQTVKDLARAQRPDGGWSLAGLLDNRADPLRQTEVSRKARADKGHGQIEKRLSGRYARAKIHPPENCIPLGWGVYIKHEIVIKLTSACRNPCAWPWIRNCTTLSRPFI